MTSFALSVDEVQTPEGWRPFKLKHIAPFVNRGVAPTYSAAPSDIRVFNQKCIRPDRTIDLGLAKFHEPVDAGKLARGLLRQDDILVNSTGTGTLGRVARYSSDGGAVVADGHVTIIRCDPARVHSAYLAYVLGTDDFYRYANEALAVGATNQTELNRDRLRSLAIPLPPHPQQVRTAAWLDGTLRKVGRLAGEQSRQRSLLDEAERETVRRLVIGADQPGGRVQRGPYWLGPTPDTWSPHKIAWRFLTGSGTTPKSTESKYYGGSHPWLNTGECRDALVTSTAKTITDVALEEHSSLRYYPAGSLVVAMYGATIGRLAILGVPMTVNQACCVLHRPTELDPAFVFFWLWAHRSELMSMGEGGGQQNINQEVIRQLRIPAPDLAQQQDVVLTIRKVLDRNRAVKEEIDRQLTLMLEHRQAVISAAVNGQVDITREVP
ncbi:restriction endonuclease subunit S [Puerhibacterium sp. TATVAM-FAB25]|uniref:restriction endonuclease subunit S n=1 Tax=Puerhibacterium sp. TATVAM-FAB25 TaxID=3093699 RepID=UPI00397C8EB6